MLSFACASYSQALAARGSFKRALPTDVTAAESHDPNAFILKILRPSLHDARARPRVELERPASAQSRNATGAQCHPMAAIMTAHEAQKPGVAKRRRPASARMSRDSKCQVYEAARQTTASGRPASAAQILGRTLREEAKLQNAVRFEAPSEHHRDKDPWAHPALRAEDIVAMMLERADGHMANRALTVSEMRTFLIHTPFEDILNYLNGDGLRVFKGWDGNADGELSEGELVVAVQAFLDLRRAGDVVKDSISHDSTQLQRKAPKTSAESLRRLCSVSQGRIPGPFVDQARRLWVEQRRAACAPKTTMARQGEVEESRDGIDDFEVRLRGDPALARYASSDEDEESEILYMDSMENENGAAQSFFSEDTRQAWGNTPLEKTNVAGQHQPDRYSDGKESPDLPPPQYVHEPGEMIEIVPSLT